MSLVNNYTQLKTTKQVLCSQSLHLKGGLEGVCVCVSGPDSWGYLHAHTVSHAVTQASCWALITSDKAWLAFYLGEPGLIWKSLSLTKRDPFLKDSKAKVKPDFAPLPLYFLLSAPSFGPRLITLIMQHFHPGATTPLPMDIVPLALPVW